MDPTPDKTDSLASAPSAGAAAHRAPLAAAAAAMTAGVVAGRMLPMPLGFWAVLLAAGVVAAVASLARRHLGLVTSAALLVAMVAIGAWRMQLCYFAAARDDVATYTGDSPILATLQGTIVTSPMRYADTTSLGYRRPDRTGFLLQAKRIMTKTGWSPAGGLVRVMVLERTDALAAGQHVELVGTIGRFREPANPGQFDRAEAARLNGTLVWMTVPAQDGAAVLDEGVRPWYSRMYWNLRAATRQHLAELDADQDTRILNTLIIGERDPSIARLNEIMARAGISHYLSISGSHLAVFFGFVYLLCRLAMLRPRASAAVVLAVLTVYLLVAEPNPPLLRSAIMAASLCLAAMSGRRYSSLNALSAAAVVLLAMDPRQLFMAGFQLSFVTVLGMVLLNRPVRALVFGRWLRRRGLAVFRSDQRIKRWVHHKAEGWIVDGVTLALVASATAAPLAAWHFGFFSPYAAVLTLALLPLVAMVLIPGYISMALLWPMPGLSYTVGRLAAWSAELLSGSVQAISFLPGLTVQLRPVGPGWAVLCYAVVVAAVFARRLPFGRALAAGGAVALAAWTVFSQLPSPRPALAELHMLAVGTGQCAVLRAPSGGTFVIDAGALAGYDAYREVLKPALLSLGLPMPRAAFISHANADHFNALPGLVKAGGLRRVYLNDYFAAGPRSASFDEAASAELMRLMQDSGVQIVRLRGGASVRLDSRTAVEVLWPPADRRQDLSTNNTSLVLRITCDDLSVVLAGDLDELGQRGAAQAANGIAADALVLPHHGGWEDSLPAFFDAVRPRLVLVSASKDPDASGVDPANDRSRFYGRMYSSCRYCSTCRDGWVRLSFGRGRLDVTTMRRAEPGR